MSNSMNLVLPTVTVTLGPTWANQINGAFTTVAEHDHSFGKGVAITPSGLNLSSDLDFQFNSAFNLKSTKFQTQSSTLVGASNASSIYTVNGNLYYTTGSGIAVQITDGSSIITVPTSSDNFQFNNVASNLTINPFDAYVIINLDCSVSRLITLPPADSVTPGRFYIIKDATNSSESFPATINPNGVDEIDGNTSDTLNSDGVARMYTSNGVDGWSII